MSKIIKNILTALCIFMLLQTTDSIAIRKKGKPAPAKKGKRVVKKAAPAPKPVIAPLPIPTPAAQIIDLEKEAMAKEVLQLRKELAEQRDIVARMPSHAEREAHERTIAELRTELGHAQTAVARLDALAKQQAEELQALRQRELVKERAEKQAAPEERQEPRVIPAEPETHGAPPPPPPPPGPGKREVKPIEHKKEAEPKHEPKPRPEAPREDLFKSIREKEGKGLRRVKVEEKITEKPKQVSEVGGLLYTSKLADPKEIERRITMRRTPQEEQNDEWDKD